ncbi:hypothetical protein A3A38_04725 [Candidatus Kaiserbacteria bacterium RIFCSPLOWO2_01_FULL_53_17]|uniref:DNA topoisomerase (ATP-hydrolyzing) n=1 Tax=Candidatus Kaiserbacteria bacterium RIFCSPLOWO2_01_FULL_53_17 TaxID=1798511 RepID=A0A1F6EHQ0_9BACT|nr:MAG: hypothetical protein A3A38_04725 [Candidatus Kaiserbacteria bacterium RIFCSPLOWO2_01_FULL_53_17]
MAETKAKKGSYGAADITVLEGLEAVRRRPGMYIGTTGPSGLHHLLVEVFDNSRDEAMGGHANDIEVALLSGNRVRVADNGRGIPTDIHPKTKVSALETVMTVLHAGGKFGGEGYKVSGGLHGVGVSVVNALSVYVRAEVHRDGGKFVQEYKNGGKPVGKTKRVGTSKEHGTIITFEPDPTIFKEGREFDFETIVSHMRQQAYLVKGLRISILDLRGAESVGRRIDDESVMYLRDLDIDAPSTSFYFEGGLKSLVSFQNRHQTPVHKNVFYIEKEQDGVTVEIALQYVDDISSRLSAFANNIYNAEGGMHVTGFKTALTRTLNNASKGGNGKEGDSFTGDDVLEGLTAVVSIKMREVQFEGQTKSKLGSVEARGATDTVFAEAFTAFLEEHPEDMRAILGKATLAMKARKAAKAAKDSVMRKGALEGLSLPGKLADCQSKDASESELFVVEGDSAGGCWSGDTKVALADGRSLSFIELIEENKRGIQNFCYTMRDDGHVGVAPILNPRLTKHSAQVIKIILDSGDEQFCTPDHKFRLVDGSYVQAQRLTPQDSISPLYRKISRKGDGTQLDGYEMTFDPKAKRWMPTHVIADIYNLAHGIYSAKAGNHRHHLDFNKRNNDPTNIMRVSYEEHMAIHYTYMEGALHRPDVKQKSIEAKRTTEYRERARHKSLEKRALFSANAKKQWDNPAYKVFMTAKFLEFYNSNAGYRNRNNELLNKNQREYWARAQNRMAQSTRTQQFFASHPERKEELRTLAQTQWNDEQLRTWRSGVTKKQWTPEFRTRRTQAYNETYLRRGLAALHALWLKTGTVDAIAYDQLRKDTRDKTLIRLDSILNRFFGGDMTRLNEAVANYNHRIISMRRVEEKMDVYDLEVAGTHNFALASGIFVHNSGKMGRDRRTQAVLPLRGKILNVERARLDKMLVSEQIRNLVIAMGTAIGDVFDISKLRYHKIIIATDADVDGAHIRTLLLTLFYRHFRPIIDGGFLFIAQPPLYKIKKGKEIFYAYTEEEKIGIAGKDAQLESTEADDAEEPTSAKATAGEGKRAVKITVQRYKGLGEMNAEELWETTMDPARRILKLVTIEDAADADRTFDILMGTDVPSRKTFIQTHAKEATLDI